MAAAHFSVMPYRSRLEPWCALPGCVRSIAMTSTQTDAQGMNNLQRLLVGGLGGLAAVLVRYLSRDHDIILLSTESDIPLAAKEFGKLWAGYFVFTPIMIFLGAMIGWISEETHKVKLFALGVSAPALITTYSAAQPEKQLRLNLDL